MADPTFQNPIDPTQSLEANAGIPAGQTNSPWTAPSTSVVPVNQIAPTTALGIGATMPSTTNGEAHAAVASANTTANNVQSYIEQATAPKTPEQLQSDALTNQVSGLIEQNTGKVQALNAAETAAGVPDITKQLQDLSNQIRTESAAYDKTVVDLEVGSSAAGKADITAGMLTGQQGAVLRQKASAIALLQARALGLQGNLEAALKVAAKSVDLQYADREDQINTKMKQLELLNRTLNKQEAIQATALNRKYEQDQKNIAEEKAQVKTNLGIAIEQAVSTPYANQNGMFFDSRTGQAFKNEADFYKAAGVSSFEEAYNKGLVTDVKNTKLTFQIEKVNGRQVRLGFDSQGKLVSKVDLGSSGAITSKSTKLTSQVIDDVGAQLQTATGHDGRLSAQDYNDGLKQWTDSGYSADSYKKNYGQFINPNHKEEYHSF